MQKLLLGTFALLALTHAADASPPAWWADHDTVKKSGSILTVLCRGGGADKSLSYHAAIVQCRAITSEHLRDSEFRIQTLSVETEQNIAYHSEQAMDVAIMGLKTEVEKEFTERDPSGEFVTYLRCKTDLSQGKVKNIDIQTENKAQAGRVVQDVESRTINDTSVQNYHRTIIHGEDRLIVLSIIPGPCDSIIIRGKQPRSVRCKESPVNLLLRMGDKQLLIRKSGYKPKTLQVDLSQAADDTIAQEVLLEKL